MKTIFFYLMTASFLVCCGQAAAPKAGFKLQDTMLLAAKHPVPKELPTSEYHHFYDASRHFYDSLFLHGFNGGLLVARDGEVVYERYSGFKNVRYRKDSINAHTAFHLASVSKTFTAMAVLKLWEDGKLDIHDDISKYLTGFPPGITIKNLLSQRSGLMNYVHFMDNSGWDKRKFLTNADLLQYIIQHKAQVQHAPPGRHFEYSNTNYAFLALIIEKASGEPYAEFITKTFFEPLQMHDSYVFALQDTSRATRSYKQNGRPYPLEYLDVVYGDKNIYSTPEDMLKWDAALRGKILFKQSTLDSAYTPYSLEKPGRRNYGLGWRMIVYPNGKKLIYHNGWWHGNRTVFIRMMEEDATIIALCNNDNKRVYSSKKLCDTFGNYQQEHETPDEGENDPEGRGGEKR
ncbi:MAG: serine hydrolase domain-containing protein [Bacteroidota bacterium]|nr:serine hydrolase domain-containing protein [Bacteroidota bacterium]MDP4214425.1 serine hydrolase domain-containing protein [Bacteroidota bacterium]MDP4249557.1 serine hydrolase domain-containing protein [Bacteroidota bacterium]